MNERIRKLADQAKQYAREQLDHSMEPLMFSADVFQTKFAQLIIRECAKIADLADENKCEWIGGNILTHFGVEE